MPIQIQLLNNRARVAVNQELWFYIDESDTDLELVDVEPSGRWQKDSSMIETDCMNGRDIQRILLRFRSRSGASRDFIAVLEFKAQG